ncbi:MAG TPA: hypothetical protein DCY00_03825 [Actinobacteria bacterium]|nr:hypothetical protein [Actinomycetota bacterium]
MTLANQLTNCIYNSQNHFIEDLYSLALCDYIFGPPSTFSMWASFYGEVPLRFITNPDTDLSLDKFKKIIYQNYYEDGTCVFE